MEAVLHANNVRMKRAMLGVRLPEPEARQRTFQIEVDIDTIAGLLQSLNVVEAKQVKRVDRCFSRRPVVLVTLSDSSCLLLKWLEGEIESSQELEKLDFLNRLALPNFTRSSIQKVRAGYEQGRLIVLDALCSCVSLEDLLIRGSPLSTIQLVSLALTLAGLHDTSITEARAEHPEWVTQLLAPKDTVLDLHEYSHGMGQDFDVYLRTMQELEPNFRELHRNWTIESFIHYDLRDDNVLFSQAINESSIRVIDWEFAGFGDPMYDLGTLVGCMCLPWLRSNLRSGQNPSETLASAHRNISIFLSAYKRSAPEKSVELKVIQYAGIALLARALARLERVGLLGGIGNLCLKFGKLFVTDPLKVSTFLVQSSTGQINDLP